MNSQQLIIAASTISLLTLSGCAGFDATKVLDSTGSLFPLLEEIKCRVVTCPPEPTMDDPTKAGHP